LSTAACLPACHILPSPMLQGSMSLANVQVYTFGECALPGSMPTACLRHGSPFVGEACSLPLRPCCCTMLSLRGPVLPQTPPPFPAAAAAARSHQRYWLQDSHFCLRSTQWQRRRRQWLCGRSPSQPESAGAHRSERLNMHHAAARPVVHWPCSRGPGLYRHCGNGGYPSRPQRAARRCRQVLCQTEQGGSPERCDGMQR
jgi:hypothetical protein